MSTDQTPTPLDLEAIRQRVKAATPGPWLDEYSGPTGSVVMDVESRSALDHVARCPHYRGQADAAFIAHAREDVPALLGEVERLRAGIAALAVAGARGIDLTPTTREQVTQGWLYDYLAILDGAWRDRVRALLTRQTEGA